MASEYEVKVVIEVLVEDWIAEARRGSPESLGLALEAYRAYLVQVALDRLTPSIRAKEDVSDVVQETFLEAWRDFRRFRGQTSAEWKAWLRKIFVHNLNHLLRRYRHTEKRNVENEVSMNQGGSDGGDALPLPADLSTPSARAMRKERDEEVEQALARLTPRERLLVSMRYEELCTFQEMGRRLGCSAVAARAASNKALDRLRDELSVSSTPGG